MISEALTTHLRREATKADSKDVTIGRIEKLRDFLQYYPEGLSRSDLWKAFQKANPKTYSSERSFRWLIDQGVELGKLTKSRKGKGAIIRAV